MAEGSVGYLDVIHVQQPRQPGGQPLPQPEAASLASLEDRAVEQRGQLRKGALLWLQCDSEGSVGRLLGFEPQHITTDYVLCDKLFVSLCWFPNTQKGEIILCYRLPGKIQNVEPSVKHLLTMGFQSKGEETCAMGEVRGVPQQADLPQSPGPSQMKGQNRKSPGRGSDLVTLQAAVSLSAWQ